MRIDKILAPVPHFMKPALLTQAVKARVAPTTPIIVIG